MFLKLLSSSAFIVFSFKSLASGFGVEIVNWYSFVLSRLLTFFLPGLSHEMLVKKVEFWSPVLASSFVVFLLFFLSRLFQV